MYPMLSIQVPHETEMGTGMVIVGGLPKEFTAVYIRDTLFNCLRFLHKTDPNDIHIKFFIPPEGAEIEERKPETYDNPEGEDDEGAESDVFDEDL
mmetsp:Transcript_35182/g.49943  ORF Transcript_35182/g.49943 Transcript_35182/m.49943 type:complete len:95 (+) Transcript_35182:75-359(+)|eukprot:CAMPEP_0202472056 /NCGR_PEP_ID=MMETSP1360-20130828/86558_1 /ASSEMBLY_ACC=CAM_ASM_000848 /TAXON_ID=515479 /ORGANISM="Licmophora paradoxa, Strain CCMP2313" /LENGTH=94 /DNA_ID=CAMNT_0049098359 /DNA_START=60 /DNA_END=344 /DNA_ORIENTATION=+